MPYAAVPINPEIFSFLDRVVNRRHSAPDTRIAKAGPVLGTHAGRPARQSPRTDMRTTESKLVQNKFSTVRMSESLDRVAHALVGTRGLTELGTLAFRIRPARSPTSTGLLRFHPSASHVRMAHRRKGLAVRLTHCKISRFVSFTSIPRNTVFSARAITCMLMYGG